MTEEAPVPEAMTERVKSLVARMNGYRARMEHDNPDAAASFVLAASRLLELLPFMLRDYDRMRSLTDVDPDKCRAVFLGCDRRISGEYDRHEEHFDHDAGTYWSRGSRGEITMTYGH